MDREEYKVSRYDGAVMLLPHRFREAARRIERNDRAVAEELRLRFGTLPTLLLHNGEIPLGEEKVTKKDLEMLLDMATQASSHTVRENIREGFITVRGGYRIGVCGSAAIREGEVIGFQNISSVAVRISKEIKGAADTVMQDLMEGGFKSTLIISPPGGGKTTLLRDVLRQLSDGCEAKGIPPFRVALADERSEVSAPVDGVSQMDVGMRTDILTGCPKAAAMMMLLRSMNPEIIAADEITAPEDVLAMETAANCGIKLLATAHAESFDDLKNRALYRLLLEKGIFERAVLIRKTEEGRSYEVQQTGVREW